MASSFQTIELRDVSNGPSNPCDVIEATLLQSDLKDELNGIYREMGLGPDIAATFRNPPKRPIEEVSEAEVTSLTKCKKTKKPKDADSNQTAPDRDEPENEKSKKYKPVVKCISCLETKHINQFPKYLPSSSCDHGREMCRMCIIAWIRTQVQGWKMPCCALCFGTVSYAYVEWITKKEWDRDILNRFKKLLFRTAASKIPDFAWCIAPGCDYGQVHHRGGQEETDAVFFCHGCQVRSCIDCDVQWHEGQTCLDYQQNGRLGSEPTPRDVEIAEDERKSKKALRARTRRCPGSGCGAPIMQDSTYDGCDKVKCSQCQLEFCWRCGADYRSMKANKRSAHKENCYWHERIFKLWRRAPVDDVVAEWDGMPQTTTPNASYLHDHEDTSFRAFHLWNQHATVLEHGATRSVL